LMITAGTQTEEGGMAPTEEETEEQGDDFSRLGLGGR